MDEPGKLDGYEFEASLIHSEFQVSQGNIVRRCSRGKERNLSILWESRASNHLVPKRGMPQDCMAGETL